MKPWTAKRRSPAKLAVVGTPGHNNRWPTAVIRKGARMYAICFDLDQDGLARHYPDNTPTAAYHCVYRVLQKFGFTRQQGSVYFGDEHVTPVTCVMAVQAVQREHGWFAKVVNDIRMLRIEEHNDLMPAIGELDLFDQGVPPAAAAG